MSAGLKGYCYSHSSAVSPQCSVEHCSAQWRSTVAVSKITSSNYAVCAFLLCWPFLPHRPHMVLLTTHSHVVWSVCWAHTSKMCKTDEPIKILFEEQISKTLSPCHVILTKNIFGLSMLWKFALHVEGKLMWVHGTLC